MTPTKEISKVIQDRFAAYETGDPGRVMAIYSDDVSYWDTQTPGRGASGREAVHRHVTAFLERFDVRYAVLEEHRLAGQDAAIVLWECSVRRRLPGGALSRDLVMQRGMNLLGVRDALVCREESYMDLASLERLFAAEAA